MRDNGRNVLKINIMYELMGQFRTVKTSLYRLTRLVLYGSTNNTNARQMPVASNNVLIAAMYGFLLDDCDL